MAGTDTEIGKTFVACALARAWTSLGFRVVAIKPVESGCADLANEQRDGVRLARSTGQKAPTAALQSLALPLAPPLAAAREGIRLSMQDWLSRIDLLGRDYDLRLVEGAGGLLSPLTDDENSGDLARELAAEVLLVAPDRLGTLNHTLLTVEALGHRGLQLAAIVLSSPEQPDSSTGTNGRALSFRVDVPVVELPRCGLDVASDLLSPLARQLVSGHLSESGRRVDGGSTERTPRPSGR